MALAIDASSPAVATQATVGTATVTTASFTPPAGSVLVIAWAGNNNGGATATTPGITDNLGSHLTYTLSDWVSHSDNASLNAQAAIWTAPVVTSAAMTVTVTNNGSVAVEAALKIWVLTGENAVPAGAHGKSLAVASTSAIAQSYTAQATSGWGFLAVCDWNATGSETAGTGCTVDATGSVGAGQISYAMGRRTTADDSNGSSNSLNTTLAAASTNLGWAYVEIVPAASAAVADPGYQYPALPPHLLYELVAAKQSVSAPVSGPKTYYVSAVGSDSNDGLSSSTPWQTISKVNGTTLAPGDAVLFRGGDTFSGQVAPTTSGTATAPIVYNSYGTGNATISNTTADAFAFVSHGGFEVRNLTIVGGTTSFSNGSAGVDCYSPTAGRFDYIVVDSCDISGFEFGVIVGGDTNVDGFTNVTVNNVNAHGNKDTGIAFWGGTYDGTHFSNQNITVTNCTASGNLGDSAKGTPNGIGIVLGMCSTGLVDQCVAHGNGGSNGTGSGPIGIWTYDSTSVTIQRSLSYSNRTSSTTDGGGFDLDNNVTSSTIQYCMAYDNDGAGLLGFNGGSAWSGNTFRYNITWGNGRNNSTAYGEMVFGGPVATSNVYGNTCVARDNGATPVACLILNATPTGLTFRNNIFVAQTGNNALASSAWATSAAFMQGNDYFRSGGMSVKWGATTYTSLATWRATVTGQEQVSGVNVGLTSDPVLSSPGTTPAVTTVAGMATYTDLQLLSSSPLIQAGLDLLGTFGVDPGTRDFWGDTLTVPLSVGADEFNGVPAEAAVATGAALDASVAIGANAEAAAATGAAQDAAASLGAQAGNAAATGAGQDAAAASTANAEAAAATGAGLDAIAAVGVNAEAANATGIALDATVTTSGSTNAAAEVAVATGTALDATAALGANADAAAATGVGLDAVSALTVNAEVPAGAGAALDALAAITVNAEAATAIGAALDATVSTSAGTNAPAEAATATGAALDATVAITVAAEAAVAAGVALSATAAANALAEPAAASAAAWDALAALTVQAEAALAAALAADPIFTALPGSLSVSTTAPGLSSTSQAARLSLATSGGDA